MQNNSKVKFVQISKASYDALQDKDASTVYFVADTDGNQIIADNVVYSVTGDGDVFFAEYGSETFTDVSAAVTAGKLIVITADGSSGQTLFYIVTGSQIQNNAINFWVIFKDSSSDTGIKAGKIVLDNTNTWAIPASATIGGDINIIETVKVNGTALVPDANKAVDIIVPEMTVTAAQNFAMINSKTGNESVAFIASNHIESDVTQGIDFQVNSGDPAQAFINQTLVNKSYVDTAIAGIPGVTVDQTYDSESTNAQSGTAVAEAVMGLPTIDVTVDETSNTADAFFETAGMTFDIMKALEYVRLYFNSEEASDNVTLPSKTYVDTKVSDLANPTQSVTINANGQLEVGGRLGQMEDTTGIYAPQSINPKAVGDGSMLITEASGTSLGPKSLAVTTGTNLTCRSAAAGATTYRVANTYENRIKCALLRIDGAVLALNEADAKLGNYSNVLTVRINGADFTPSSAPDDTSNDIVITVDKTVNPSAATTTIRAYPAERNFSTVHAGQGIASNNGNGASVIVGQAVVSYGGNANNIVGASIYNQGNGNTVVGRQHISRKNRWLLAGTGHDNTNGKAESGAALGSWSVISSDTEFVIGNGTSNAARANLFEIKTNGDVYINGVKVLP